MDLLVKVIIGGEYNSHISAAKISLDDALINEIFKLSRRATRGKISTVYDSTPSLGTSDLDLENHPIKDLATLTEEESQQVVFKKDDEVRMEFIELHVDSTDFWWEGAFKHTNSPWETEQIPLSLLPKLAESKPQTKKIQSGSLPDLNMTAEQMNAIHEKIACGMNHGLNAREIDVTFQRHVTKAQLIRVIMELLERNH